MTQNQNTVYFCTRDELSKVCLSNVMYVASDGNYITLKIKSGRTMTLLASLQNFLQVTETFRHLHFARLGRSHVVNVAYISKVNNLRRTITLIDDDLKENVELIASKESVRALRHYLLSTHCTPIPHFQTANGNMEAYQITEP